MDNISERIDRGTLERAIGELQEAFEIFKTAHLSPEAYRAARLVASSLGRLETLAQPDD